jgi:hypothetical protein
VPRRCARIDLARVAAPGQDRALPVVLVGAMALRLWVLGVLVACAGLAAPAVAQLTPAPAPPPEAPILRIEPGMHIAPILRIGVDAGCRLMITGSDDKTVRLWQLPPDAAKKEGKGGREAAAFAHIAPAYRD